jgi:thiol-disulfide isomerase/thioredoxin
MTKNQLWILIGGLALFVCVCIVIGVAGAGVYYFISLSREVATYSQASIYDEQADAKQDIAQALTRSQVENKYVLLDFGADWCPDCHALANFFEDEQLKTFIDEHYIVVHIDVGYWDRNLDIAEKYDDPISNGIPAVVILDPTEQIITSTREGELATARTATKEEIFAFLKQWAPEKP